MARKPRSDSKLDAMPPEHRARLCEWLLSGVPYHRAKEMVKGEFKVETSLASLSAFYEKYCGAALIAQRQRAVSVADQIADEAGKNPDRFDAATIAALSQKGFELASSPGADPKEVKSIFMLLLRVNDQKLAARQLELDSEKFRTQIKSNVERGLDALYERIKGNKAAEKLFAELKSVVLAEVDNAA